MIIRVFLTAILFAGFISIPFAQIRVGDMAPPLSIQEWIKGEPIPELKTGNVYVVEFSSVNCPPCRKAIPHLSDLAKEYAGKVQVLSIYTMESNPDDPGDLTYLTKTRGLVTTLQDKIDFTVAADVPQQTTGNAWNVAGTPQIFLINRLGQIAWYGNNSKSLDILIPQVLNNTLDASAVMQQEEAFKNMLRHSSKLKEEGQYLRTVEILDSLGKARPEHEELLLFLKFDALAGDDDRKANELLRWMLSQPLKGFTWDKFLSHTWIYPKEPDFNLVLLTADRAIAEAETDKVVAHLLTEKAQILRIMNRRDKNTRHLAEAVKVMELAVEKSKSVDAAFVDRIQAMLYYYEFLYRAVTNEKKANRYLQQLFKQRPYSDIWNLYIDSALEVLKKPDYNLLLAITDQMIKQSEGESPVAKIISINRKAKILETKGDLVKAIEWYEQGLALCRPDKDKYYIEVFEKRIKGVKAKLEKTNPGK